MPTYYPIDEAAARRAKEMNRYYDYKPESATATYRQEVDKAADIAGAQKARVDPLNQNGIYAAKELMKQWMAPAEQTEITTEQPISEEPCSEGPAPFSYPQQSM